MIHISEKNREAAKKIVSQMTLEEKARMHAGKGAWHTETVERIGLNNICLTDGPHGLRNKLDESKPLSIENTVPATCFPAACANSCSYDRELLYEMGVAMAKECLQENVGVILGPAVNIKRSPLCGRNFEYVSEDPFVAGEIATALINGIQSQNVGTSLKHFLANSQETARLSSSSVIDERTLREIYLPAFEMAVKNSQPFTIMCSYNMINGIYASNHKRLINDILRDEWGFEGLVMTDWGAMDNRAQSVRSGIDLEMPSKTLDFDLDIIEAVNNGELDEKSLDTCIERVVAVVLQTRENKAHSYDKEKHNKLARRIARESAVLLRNENSTLPLTNDAHFAIIGEFAEKPRYQGAGSSLINPIKLTNTLEALQDMGISAKYAKGYDVTTDQTDEKRLLEAIALAKSDDVDTVIAIVGLPDIYESESYDRKHIQMPDSHNRLIDELVKTGKKIVAVILAGSSVEIPWREKVDSILLMNLSGQNVGGAMCDILFGNSCPCGKLTESFPICLEDTPSFCNFGSRSNVEYRESVFVGYRYYDSANRPVAYPFGFGLSYTSFEYSNIRLSADSISDTRQLTVSATIKNTGNMLAKEIVQLYVKAPASDIFRPVHELRGFEKIELAPGESKQVSFTLSKRDFAYYNVNINDWHVISGVYTIEIAASSRDIRLQANVNIDSTVDAVVPNYKDISPMYYTLERNGNGILDIPHEQFAALFTDKTHLAYRPTKPFTENSTLRQLLADETGKKLADEIISIIKERSGADELTDEWLDTPLRSAIFPLGRIDRATLANFVDRANGKA